MENSIKLLNEELKNGSIATHDNTEDEYYDHDEDHDEEDQEDINKIIQNKYYCELCKIHLKNKCTYNKHLKGISHLKKDIISNNHCKVCNYSSNKSFNFNTHLSTKKHKHLVEEYIKNSNLYICKLCGIKMKSKTEYKMHFLTNTHSGTLTSVFEKACNTPDFVFLLYLLTCDIDIRENVLKFCKREGYL